MEAAFAASCDPGHQVFSDTDIIHLQVKEGSIINMWAGQSHPPQSGTHPLTIDLVSLRPEALPLNVAWKDESDPEWTRLRTVMDSGAAESV